MENNHQKMHVRCRVPQGSVLGLTLFTLFRNDLTSFIKSGETFMYADDTTVFCTGSSWDIACNLLNCALEELFTGVTTSLLHILGSARLCYSPKRGLLVRCPPFILASPSWIPPLKEVIKNFVNKLTLLKKSKFLPSHVSESFYVKVIQPSIMYVMPVWGGVNQTELF